MTPDWPRMQVLVLTTALPPSSPQVRRSTLDLWFSRARRICYAASSWPSSSLASCLRPPASRRPKGSSCRSPRWRVQPCSPSQASCLTACSRRHRQARRRRRPRPRPPPHPLLPLPRLMPQQTAPGLHCLRTGRRPPARLCLLTRSMCSCREPPAGMRTCCGQGRARPGSSLGVQRPWMRPVLSCSRRSRKSS
jgi:hypothetical protein